MTMPLTVESYIHFGQRGRGGHKEMRSEDNQAPPPVTPGRLPRVARLMALAIKFDGLLRERGVENYAELARLGHVSRARISQVMNLLNLAPDIQEALLFLPRTQQGRDPMHLAQLQPIAGQNDWKQQRRHWNRLRLAHSLNASAK